MTDIIDIFRGVDWNVVAAAGQASAAFIAAWALIFLRVQIRDANRAGDLASLRAFFGDTNAREDAFSSGPTDDSFHDFMNHLELYAAAYNGKLFPRTSRKIVKGKLCDSIVLIQNSDWAHQLSSLLTTPRTLLELRKFATKHRRQIQRLSALHRAKQATRVAE